jgi:molybdate transport system regulatory protein
MYNALDGPQYRLKLDDKIILLNDQKFELLNYIDEYGSITEASKQVHISYRRALKYIGDLENDFNNRIVSTKIGGKGGGGSKLTDQGKLILKEYIKVNSILKMHADVNEIEGTISDIDVKNRIANIYLNDNKIILPLRENFDVGDKVLVLIRPEDIFIKLKAQDSSVKNIFKGKIISMNLQNQMVRLTVDIGAINLFVEVTDYLKEQLNLNLGKAVYIGFKAAALTVIKI